MRNVAVLFITQERLRAEIFIDTVRTFKGLKGSVDSEDQFHLQEAHTSSAEEPTRYKGWDPWLGPCCWWSSPSEMCFVIDGKRIVSCGKILDQHILQGAGVWE